MIDLHLHTTASDGRLAPDALVHAARDAGLTTIAVTDHDTLAAVPTVAAEARACGIAAIPGIEVTAVANGRDIHVLGYFLDLGHDGFADFLAAQRADRRRRVAEILDRLTRLGMPVDRPLPGESADPTRALGRPSIARALVEAGHVASIADAFDRFLSEGQPAFVPREGASPAEVVARITEAGGLASFAHPGKMHRDDLLPAMTDAGLAAIEVFHPDHAAADVERYLRLATEFGLAATGGSDYHGPGSGRAPSLGLVTLPPEEFAGFAARATARRHA